MKKRQWKLIYKGSVEEFESRSMDYWQTRPSFERFEETRSLIDQAMKMQGKTYADVSRLLRTTAVLKRP